MIRLSFVTGSAIRKVFIKKREITLLSAELNFEPLIINLDKIDENNEKFKKINLTNEQIQEIKKLSLLGNEEAIALDIIKDFQRIGWRLIKRDGFN